MSKKVYLSYILDENTPTYGNKYKFRLIKKRSILNGDTANDSFIETTAHIGTHVDMPYHFYENGQTIENFDINYFIFNHILFVEVNPINLIIKDELLRLLNKYTNKGAYDAIIVKTGICYRRNKEEFWKENFGFHPDVAEYIRINFPNVRIFGFDSISVSSFTDRNLGRKAHQVFLKPEHPILLIEDMNLTKINSKNRIKNMIVAPIRISNCDGLPCTIIGDIE